MRKNPRPIEAASKPTEIMHLAEKLTSREIFPLWKQIYQEVAFAA